MHLLHPCFPLWSWSYSFSSLMPFLRPDRLPEYSPFGNRSLGPRGGSGERRLRSLSPPLPKRTMGHSRPTPFPFYSVFSISGVIISPRKWKNEKKRVGKIKKTHAHSEDRCCAILENMHAVNAWWCHYFFSGENRLFQRWRYIPGKNKEGKLNGG